MIVVDASVAVKWLVPEADSTAAEHLAGQPLCAPDLLLAEIVNALWAMRRRGRLAAVEATSSFARLARVSIDLVPAATLADDALALSCRLDHPAYDCFYLALAIERGTHVVTADRRFVAAADAHAETKGRVRALGAVTPPAA
jgi:predicted nucleic acid-binding protein